MRTVNFYVDSPPAEILEVLELEMAHRGFPPSATIPATTAHCIRQAIKHICSPRIIAHLT